MNRLGPFFTNKKLASPLVWMPVWIHMDNQYVRLNSKEEIELACRLTCIYHNGPDNRAPFCEEDGDWHTVTRKEALLAACRPPESESSSCDGEEVENAPVVVDEFIKKNDTQAMKSQSAMQGPQ